MNKTTFVVLVPIASIFLCLVIALTADHWRGQRILDAFFQRVVQEERAYRVANREYHHGLTPTFSTDNAVWGERIYSIRTNSLGFKDAAVRSVGIIARKPRFVFIGDSFTEGIGMNWSDSFVGIFARKRPDLEVLNAAATSYSPVIYLRKLEWLIAQGYLFDEAVIYLDISDIQDDGFIYSLDNNEHLRPDFGRCEWTTIDEYRASLQKSDKSPPIQTPSGIATPRSHWRARNFPVTNQLIFAVRKKFLPTPIDPDELKKPPFNTIRGRWTVESDLPCYGPHGVEGAIGMAKANMTKVSRLLTQHGIRFSVAVYPWPEQLVSDTVNSRQVDIWKSWCTENGCHKFVNHFPDFFLAKPVGSWPRDLFIDGDYHFSERGHKLIAKRLIEEFAH